MTGAAQPECGGSHLAAEGENDLLQGQARDSPPSPPLVEEAMVGSALPAGYGGCQLAAEGESAPVPTGLIVEAVMVGILPGCGGGHLAAEGRSNLLQEQGRRSPNGPMVCVSSGLGQHSSSAAAGSKSQASSDAAAAAGGGSSSNIATSSVLGLVMVLTPVDGSSCM